MTEILQFQIAPGHDNDGALVPLYELDVNGSFWQYELGNPKTTWHSAEGMREDGTRQRQRISLPFVTLELSRVTEDEAALIESLVGPITVNLRNKQDAEWIIYNGQMWPVEWGEYEQKEGCFIDVVVELRALRELT